MQVLVFDSVRISTLHIHGPRFRSLQGTSRTKLWEVLLSAFSQYSAFVSSSRTCSREGRGVTLTGNPLLFEECPALTALPQIPDHHSRLCRMPGPRPRFPHNPDKGAEGMRRMITNTSKAIMEPLRDIRRIHVLNFRSIRLER